MSSRTAIHLLERWSTRVLPTSTTSTSTCRYVPLPFSLSVFTHTHYQAHNGLQGTVRPTHYIVIYDENNLTADQVQTGVHNTSYMYARATKAVSLVPPAYYADLACERARSYLSALLDAGDTQSAPSQGQPSTEAERSLAVYQKAVQMWGNGINDQLKNSMFYI